MQEMPAFPLPDCEPPCAVIDIHAELRYWEACYARQPFHRNGTPFRHYVPTLKFAYDTYLLAHRETLEDLMPGLATRYEQSLLRGVRLEWAVARDIVLAVWRKLRAPLHNGVSLLPVSYGALDERAIVAAAISKR